MRRDKELVCMRIIRIRDGIEMMPEFKVRTYADYLLIRKSIKESPHQFELNEQVEGRYNSPPEMEFEEGEFGLSPAEVLRGKEVPIIAQMTFRYKWKVRKQGSGHLGLVVSMILLVVAMALGLNIYIGVRDAQIANAQATCRVYTEYGRPTFMTIDNSRYELDSNGDVILEQRPFVNPWHKQIVELKNNCQFIPIR
jgi:hypothetical protein